MKLYSIYANLVDVFQGEGWLSWSRWRNIKGHWIQIGGPKIEHPALVIKELSQGDK